MVEKRPMSLEQIRAFLQGSEEIRFAGRSRKEIYSWVGATRARVFVQLFVGHYTNGNTMAIAYTCNQNLFRL